jgi:hypothetical protein
VVRNFRVEGIVLTTETNNDRVPDGPQVSAETWFALAIAAFLITLCIFGMAAGWVFLSGDDDIQRRAQAFTPFGGALIAIVTFFTIAWRGVLNTKQLEYQASQLQHQAEQLAQSRRQNDTKDEENLAKLLMDGTKLLGEEKESHVLAGIAALQAVVVSPRDTFAPQAMDILVDVISQTYKDDGRSKVFDAARRAVNNGASAGRASTRRLTLEYDDASDKEIQAINGVDHLIYKGASVYSVEYNRLSDRKFVSFVACTIEDVTIDGNHRNFRDCTISSARILTMSASFLTQNRISDSDFSGARYSGSHPRAIRDKPHPFDNLKDQGNSYEAENPPTGRVRWENYLIRIDPMPDLEEEFDEVDEPIGSDPR